MTLYYNLTTLLFKDNCTKLYEKTEIISECIYSLYDCCRNAISTNIKHFNKCEDNTEYICTYYTKQLNSADPTVSFLYGAVGGIACWFFIYLFKMCYNSRCKKSNEYSLEDLDDEEY